MGDEKKPKPVAAGFWPTIKPFVNGGASGMLATCVIQPIDMIKVCSKVFIFLSFFDDLVFGSVLFFSLNSDLCFFVLNSG
jgi:hypothetical protein